MNERDHRFVTSWPGYNVVKYAKVEEKDGAEARLVIQAIGDQDSMSGGAMFAEESDEAVDETGSEDGSEVYEVIVASCVKPESELDARQEPQQNAQEEDSGPESSHQSPVIPSSASQMRLAVAEAKRTAEELEADALESDSPKA